MPEVNIYIETDSIFQGKTDRKCGYVLSTITRHGEKTKEGFGHFAGTYHQAVLTVAAEAIGRVNIPCEICVHTKDAYVASRLPKVDEMAADEWKDTKGKAIKNMEEWKNTYKAIHKHQKEHVMSAKTEKHSYCKWLQEEMKKRTDECKRTMGTGLEPPARTGPENNGMSGYHY